MSDSHSMMLRRFLEEQHEEHGTNQHDDPYAGEKPWGGVIAAALVIQAVTLTGLFVTVAVGYFGKLGGHKNRVLHAMTFRIIPAFAAGALLATSVFLVIPEGLILLGGGHAGHGGEQEEAEEGHQDHNNSTTSDGNDGHSGHEHLRFLQEHEQHNEGSSEGNTETQIAWKFGASLLGGFLLPIVFHVFFTHKYKTPQDVVVRDSMEARETSKEIGGEQEANGEGEEVETGVASTNNKDADKVRQAGTTASEEEEEESSWTDMASSKTLNNKNINWTLASSILVGDFFHNFTDGVFVGTAFLLCGDQVAWTIVASTIYHELAQEIADYALLRYHCGFSPLIALVYNFISGFSVVLGGLVILSIEMSEQTKGVTLSIAAGVYAYIAACECVPRVQSLFRGPKDILVFLVSFIMGAVPIGLVLLNHQHCTAGHSGHGSATDDTQHEQHDGHDHFRF